MRTKIIKLLQEQVSEKAKKAFANAVSKRRYRQGPFVYAPRVRESDDEQVHVNVYYVNEKEVMQKLHVVPLDRGGGFKLVDDNGVQYSDIASYEMVYDEPDWNMKLVLLNKAALYSYSEVAGKIYDELHFIRKTCGIDWHITVYYRGSAYYL